MVARNATEQLKLTRLPGGSGAPPQDLQAGPKPSPSAHRGKQAPIAVVPGADCLIALDSLVTGLSLGTQCQDKYGVDLRDVPVQGDITARAAPDNQLPIVAGRRSADLRVCLQNVERSDDFKNTVGSVGDFVQFKMLENSIEIVVNLRGNFDPGHGSTRGFLGCWALCLYTSKSTFQVRAHLAPGDSLAGSNDFSVPRFGQVKKLA